MMETSAVGFGLAELLVLLFSGQFLGMIPGERDAQLIKSPPAAAYAYAEWTAMGPGQAGAPGLAGLSADPEIQSFLAALEKSFGEPDPEVAEYEGETVQSVRAELPTLLRLAAMHAGCVYVSVEGAPPGEKSLVPVEAALVLNLGNDTPPFLAALNKLLRVLPNYQPTDKPVNHPIPLPAVAITLHQEGPRLILAIGHDTLPRLLARWQQPQAELPQLKKFADAKQQLPVEKLGSLTWVNVDFLRQDLQQRFGVVGAIINTVGNSLGLSEIDSMLSASGTDGPDAVVRSRMNVHGSWSGLLTLLTGRPLTAEDFAHIPADADFVAATSLDLRVIHQTLHDIIRKTAPDALGGFDEFQRQLELELQLKLADVIAAFGDVVTAYDSPASGGVALTGLVAAIPVRNPDRAELVVQRLKDMLLESIPAGNDDTITQLMELPFDGETIHYLNSTGYMVRYSGQPPFSPAFCLTKRQFLVALHPQALKAHLRFLKSNEPRYAKAFESARRNDGGGVLSYVYVDTPHIAKALYPFVPLLAKPVLAGGQTLKSPLNVGMVPSARAVLPFLRESTLSVVRRPHDLLVEQRNMLPVWLSLAMVPHLVDVQGEFAEEGIMMNLNGGKKKPPAGEPAVNLGAAAGVQQAKAEAPPEPQLDVKKEPTAVEKAARRTLPYLLKSVIPPEVGGFIPDSVFEKLAQPPDPEKAAQRAADRERRKAARDAKRAARRAR